MRCLPSQMAGLLEVEAFIGPPEAWDDEINLGGGGRREPLRGNGDFLGRLGRMNNEGQAWL